MCYNISYRSKVDVCNERQQICERVGNGNTYRT